MDLRRRALGGGKTVSRKAAANEASEGANATPRGSSAASSRQSSRNTSRNPSRNPSRVPSEDEDAGSFSDDTAMRCVTLSLLSVSACALQMHVRQWRV